VAPGTCEEVLGRLAACTSSAAAGVLVASLDGSSWVRPALDC
jgi:hypothetical protein